MDQSFSKKNFLQIFDYENRRGNNLESLLSDDLPGLTAEIKDLGQRGNVEEKDEKQKEKRKLIETVLHKISIAANANTAKISISKHSQNSGAPIFIIEKTALAVFVTKQIQYNIKRLYNVRQADRNAICSNVKTVLSDKFPKIIIKTDISKFYESVNTSRIVKKLETDRLLSPASIKFIKQIFRDHKILTGQSAGLPRGIGISAPLAELYLRDFDSLIRSQSGIYYYSRYVDDMIIVATTAEPKERLYKGIVKAFHNTQLKRNRKKTEIMKNGAGKFEFLGYRYIFSSNKLCIRLTKSKVEKYKLRINLAFADYQKSRGKWELAARNLLIKRLKFLCGNTRLVNNKSHVITGIYFSNNLLSSPSFLKFLDRYLKGKIANLKAPPNLAPPRLISRLEKLNFEKGFAKRRFHKFSSKDLEDIVRVWKHVG